MFRSAPPVAAQRVDSRQSAHFSSDTEGGADNKKEGLFLFDFDGVVCDSCDECTVSALRTCQQVGVLTSSETKTAEYQYPPPWLFQKMREIRPAIEVGWQIPVLLSVFLEQHDQPDAMSVHEIVENYQVLVEDWLNKWGKTERDMVDAFGGVRDAWIADDLKSWLDINTFYPGIPEALLNCEGESILATTKQQRFAIALCRHAGVSPETLPDERIYGLGMYKKKEDVIFDRMVAGGYMPDETRFFEDRWPTLAKCLQDDRLDGVHFYLCAWGYVTEGELRLAHEEPRVQVLHLDDFPKIVAPPQS
jgi:phosphoglycolate phosphatase-like HAD superfamily hydrolase